jgi:hypothetical protein
VSKDADRARNTTRWRATTGHTFTASPHRSDEGGAAVKRRKTSSLPWFALAVVLAAISFVVPGGTAGGIVGFAAMIAFVGACLRSVAVTVDDDPERARQLMRGGIIGL